MPASHVKPFAQPHLARPTHDATLRTGNAAHRTAALRTGNAAHRAAALRTASLRAAAAARRAAAAARRGRAVQPRELGAPDRVAVQQPLPHALPLWPGRGETARALRARHRRVRRHLVRKSKS